MLPFSSSAARVKPKHLCQRDESYHCALHPSFAWHLHGTTIDARRNSGSGAKRLNGAEAYVVSGSFVASSGAAGVQPDWRYNFFLSVHWGSNYTKIKDFSMPSRYTYGFSSSVNKHTQVKQICLDTLYRSDIKPPSISEGVLKKPSPSEGYTRRGVQLQWQDVPSKGWGSDGVAVGTGVSNLKYLSWILWMPHSWWSLAASLPKVCWWHVFSFGLPWWCIGVLEMLEWVTSLIAVYDGEWGWWAAAFHGRTSQEGGECILDSSISEANIHGLVHAVGQLLSHQPKDCPYSLTCATRKEDLLSTVSRWWNGDGAIDFWEEWLPWTDCQPCYTADPGKRADAHKSTKKRGQGVHTPSLARPQVSCFQESDPQGYDWCSSRLQGGLHFYDPQNVQHVQERRTSNRSMSNVIYFFSCACEQSYVGRTAQRLEERIKQHIPANLISAAGSQKTKPKKKEKKKKNKKNKQETTTKTKRTANQGGDSADGGSQEKNVTSTTTEQDSDSTCANGENRKVLKVSKSDSGITRHLKTSSQCRVAVCKSNITARFQVIARARNASHLGFLEALFIGRHAPALCAQKEFVRTLGLF